MKMLKPLVALLTSATLFAASAAYAGPAVTVTFKHLGAAGSTTATYSTTNSNETSTYTNASPKPKTEVEAGKSDSYKVQSNISPDANYAIVRYSIGSKTCVFNTNYVNTLNASGVKVPKWNKSATASGGAICNATITSTNISTRAWEAEFTMK